MQKLFSGPLYAAYTRSDARRIHAASQRCYRPTLDPNFALRTSVDQANSMIEIANQAKAKIEEAFKKSGAPAADARAFANASPEDLQRLQQAVDEVNHRLQDNTDRIAQYQQMISDVARRQDADAQVAKMQYELVKQQAQAAEGASD
jgi:phosphoglycerate-specific signal transduction histidine kinase